ncbi:MAG: hypothetical protein AUK24_08095 [Syntrophaceae bacterium CG2_30_49_12]|nr:MAG: hypothetical protein AUK24_08095 [Syntrophaceae bacterium CG2_30_49_12]PIP06153.1 MAG: hypothetical protein COX52_08225 [Syntrophobacterales bacterium CG23_combo_of_CG06-09_8_20_14_all_48_27]PJA50015.1 MAG: hypothetical protein CO171_03745 [Syntrophobacterales bacterium CG_4_9_14_3_um_filter_49_8]PJC73241.1 MAG: hypothetical protein CO012_09840 [Syntrophobacterales bacterium CG_4_8_14_3_um_filter_49_14]
MEVTKEELKVLRWREKPSRLETFSGLPVKENYGPEDLKGTDYLKPQLEEMGITGLYGPGIPLGVIVQHVAEATKKRRKGVDI